MSARLHDKVIIVTGGASGMGRSYSLAVAAEGARVVVADILDTQVTVKEVKAGGGVVGFTRSLARELTTEISSRGRRSRSMEVPLSIDWKAWLVPLFLVLCAACSARETSAPDAIKEVRTVLTAQVDAWNRGDLEGFMAGYWKSPDLAFFSNGTETRGWQATLDRYRMRYQAEGRQMGTLDFPALDIVPLGPEAAMARGRWRLKMSDGKESSGMTSVILRKLPEGWRIVHDHSSADSS